MLGGRYNHDKYTGTSDSLSSGQAVAYTSGAYLQPSSRPGLSTGKWTGKAALQYKLAPANMIYASYTRGFKPGGLNSSASSASYAVFGLPYGIRASYKPETVDSFELGSKNRFLDNTAQLNASAFYYIYKNMQFLDEDAILYGKGTANAPRAYIYGLELEGSWLADDHWKFEGSVSALKGKFDKDYYALDPASANAAQGAAGYPGWLFWSNYYAATMARDAARANINGNDVPKLPGLQGSAAVSYTGKVGPGDLTAKVQYLYRGKYNYRLFDNSSLDKVPGYGAVNLFFRYAFEDKPYYLSLAVTNLFDKAGINSRFSDPYGSAQTFNTYIAPRQAIFTAGVNF
jgi:iron complex outermembrane receptor protein